MSTEITEPLSPAIIPARQPVVAKEDGNIAVTALVPEGVSVCQSALIEWAKRKITEVQSDVDDLRGAYEHAKAKKWKYDTFKRHMVKAQARVVFYEKILDALQHGFVIVPNFPIQSFAIRAVTENPKDFRYWGSRYQSDCKQSPALKESGEGEYQNPFPITDSHTLTAPTQNNPNATETKYRAVGWDDIDFPVSMAKPQIMEATTRAMALKIFDAIGILPAARKEDPVIIGRISRKDGYSVKSVSFMIAWHLDTRDL